jgi:hypothetical protein
MNNSRQEENLVLFLWLYVAVVLFCHPKNGRVVAKRGAADKVNITMKMQVEMT